MIPGEIRTKEGSLTINAERITATILVINSGDRPVQVGSHYHFYEVNRALRFDRLSAYGMRLNIPAGTAVRFEPGEEKPVEVVALGGTREVFGLNGLTNGSADMPEDTVSLLEELQLWEEGTRP